MVKPVFIPHFTTSYEKPTLLQINLFKGQIFRNRTTIPHSEGQPTFNVEAFGYKHTVHSQYTHTTYTVTLATWYVHGCYQPLDHSNDKQVLTYSTILKVPEH
jgi:hypothetical protein